MEGNHLLCQSTGVWAQSSIHDLWTPRQMEIGQRVVNTAGTHMNGPNQPKLVPPFVFHQGLVK